jgi:hypothetical protein
MKTRCMKVAQNLDTLNTIVWENSGKILKFVKQTDGIYITDFAANVIRQFHDHFITQSRFKLIK